MARRSDKRNGAPNEETGERELVFMVPGTELLAMSDEELDRFVDQVWAEFEGRTAERGRTQGKRRPGLAR